jgi:uncharacterized protein
MHLRNFVVVLLVLACGSVCAEELTREKRADIEQLLTMTGALSIGKQMATAVVANIVQSLKRSHPEIPQNALDFLPADVGAVFEENMASFKEEIIPIYHKYFTGAEIREMIRFYSTDLGKKTIRVMPAAMQESMLVGQRWGQALEPKIDQRIRARLKQQGIKI